MNKLDLARVAWWNLRQLGLIDPFATHEETVQALVAVQAQDFGAARQAIALRSAEQGWLDSAVEPGGPLVRLWTVRGTMHLVPCDEAGYHQVATRLDWSERWGRYLRGHLPLSVADVRERIYPQIMATLSDQPRTHQQIAELAGLAAPYDKLLPHLLKDLCYLGGCVRGPQTGGKAIYFRPWHELLPDDAAWRAQCFLLGRFVERYGPVTVADMVYWSGWRVSTVRQIVRELGDVLTVVRLGDRCDEAYLLAEQLPQLWDMTPPQSGATRFLPAFDVLLLAYRDKQRFLDNQFTSRVFLSAARVSPILLEGSRVVGTWQGQPPRVDRFPEPQE